MSLLDKISTWRRIAAALESLAKSQAIIADLAQAEEDRRVESLHPPGVKQVEIASFDAGAASRQWRRDQISRGVLEEDLEDEYGSLRD
jgi:hypothetical protein